MRHENKVKWDNSSKTIVEEKRQIEGENNSVGFLEKETRTQLGYGEQNTQTKKQLSTGTQNARQRGIEKKMENINAMVLKAIWEERKGQCANTKSREGIYRITFAR